MTYPVKCFLWDWDSFFSDSALHHQRKGNKMKALLRWLKSGPHLDNSGDLVSRAALLEICLGMGIIWKDTHLIQFMEGDHTDNTPGHIISSSWTVNDYNTFGDYVEELHKDLLHDIETARYMNLMDLYWLLL